MEPTLNSGAQNVMPINPTSARPLRDLEDEVFIVSSITPLIAALRAFTVTATAQKSQDYP